MKAMTLLGVTLTLVFGLSVGAMAEDTTLKGSVMCAKCTLKKADAKECQDVLVVKDDKGAQAEYYITKNPVAEKFGHVCSGQTPATVTGAVTEKDGKKWIAPSKMEKVS